MKRTLALSIGLLISSAALMCMEKEEDELSKLSHESNTKIERKRREVRIELLANKFGPPCLDYSEDEIDCSLKSWKIFNFLTNLTKHGTKITKMKSRLNPKWDWNTLEACRDDKDESACWKIVKYRNEHPYPINERRCLLSLLLDEPNERELLRDYEFRMKDYVDNSKSLFEAVQYYNELYPKEEKK